MTSESLSESVSEIPEDSDLSFRNTSAEVECPFDEHIGQFFTVQLGWINREFPTLHFNAPDLIEHLRAEHGAVVT